MKKVFFTVAHWFYIQLYVTFTVLFSSKARLEQIAINGGDHPLVVFGVARWARVWWLSILGIAFWFFWFGPFFKLMFYGDPKTWYAVMTYQDTVIFFGKYTIKLGYYWLGGIFAGKILQLLEIYSANKMEHFRTFLGAGVSRRSSGSHRKIPYQQLN